MHKLIMTSSAYRMSSRADAAALRADPTNAMYWRFDMRRLTAEEVRDSILAVSGELNLKMGGPSVYSPMPKEVLATASRPDAAWGRSPPEEAARRSVYIHVKRSLLPPLLTSFDMADTLRLISSLNSSVSSIIFKGLHSISALHILESPLP